MKQSKVITKCENILIVLAGTEQIEQNVALPFNVEHCNEGSAKYIKAEIQVKCSVCTDCYVQKCIYCDVSVAELKAFKDFPYLAEVSHGNHKNAIDLQKSLITL